MSESAPAKLGSPSLEGVESGVESLEVPKTASNEVSSEDPVSPLDIHPPTNLNPNLGSGDQPPLKLTEVEPPMGFADSPSKKGASNVDLAMLESTAQTGPFSATATKGKFFSKIKLSFVISVTFEFPAKKQTPDFLKMTSFQVFQT